MKIPPNSWLQYFDRNELIQSLDSIKKRNMSHCITPSQDKIFQMFELIEPERVKIMIIGEEPQGTRFRYNHGVAFAERTASNRNITSQMQLIKESAIDHAYREMFDPMLKGWIKQGVMLINSALTIERSNPLSNMDLWEPSMMSFIANFSENNERIIFVLLGGHAKKFKKVIAEGKKHSIISDLHPRDFLIKKPNKKYNFFHYANHILKQQNSEINWNISYEDHLPF